MKMFIILDHDNGSSVAAYRSLERAIDRLEELGDICVEQGGSANYSEDFSNPPYDENFFYRVGTGVQWLWLYNEKTGYEKILEIRKIDVDVDIYR